MAGLLGVLLAVCACGGRPGGGHADAGPDADAAPDASDLEPAPPEPPQMTPCPDGWQEVALPGVPDVVTCEPWPAGAPPDCGIDGARFPGSDACERVGPACPAGDFPEDLPVGATVLYVRAGEPAGGDGTLALPYATLGTALAAANDGDVIALSKGTFDGAVTVREAVTIRGACTAETVLTSSTGTGVATVDVVGRGATIRDLTISGSRPGVFVSATSTTATLDSIVVRETAALGVGVHTDGELEMRSSIVRGTRFDAAGANGINIQAASGGQLTLSRVVTADAAAANLLIAQAGTSCSATDLAVQGDGDGVQVSERSNLDLTRAVVEGSTAFGIRLGEETTFAGRDVVVRGIRPDEVAAGTGLEVVDGAIGSLDRSLFSACSGGSMSILGSSIDARDVVVVDGAGYGIQTGAGGTLDLSRAVIARTTILGVLVGDPGATFTASDLAIRDIVAPADDPFSGPGIQAQMEGVVALHRALVAGASTSGLLAVESAHIAADDLVVEGTLPVDGSHGIGVVSVRDAGIEITRFRISDNALCGAQLAQGGTIDLHDGGILRNPIGVNVQTADYDVARLQDRVRYEDNGTALDTTALPVPGPAGGF